VTGFHGLTKGPIVKELIGTPLFLTFERELAESYSDDGSVLVVTCPVTRPLVLDTPNAFDHAWKASGANEAPLPFHPNATHRLATWARDSGHDVVSIPPSAFQGTEGWNLVQGRVGEPQLIVLYPERAIWIEE